MLSKKNKIIKKQILNHINFFENISLIKFIFILPFVFALDNIFYQNYKNKSFYFLSKNLYIRNNKRQELINWETFNFFIINQINKKNLKVFNIYKNILFIELKKPLEFEFFAVIKKKNISKLQNILNKQYVIQTKNIIIESKIYDNFFIPNKTIFYLNDHIPKKLNKINLVKQNSSSLLFFDEQKKLYNNLKFSNFEKQYTIENINNKKFEFKTLNLEFNPSITKKIIHISKKNIDNPKDILTKKTKAPIFKKIINRFFYEKNIRFYIKNKKKTKRFSNFKGMRTTNFQKINILHLLNKYLFITNSKKIAKRKISGYRFLDFNKKQSLFFIIQNIKTKKTLLNILLPTTHSLLNFSIKDSLLNTFFFKNIEKNAFLGTSREHKTQKNKIIDNRKVLNFQKNLKFQTKKFRKIDDFSTKTMFTLFLKDPNALKISNKKKSIKTFSEQTSIDFSPEYIKIEFLNKNDFHYKIKTKLNFFYSQKKYVENWEFISIESWLFISKFILFIYIYFLLKELYKEYGKEFINYLIEYGKTTQDDFEALKEQYFSHESSFRVIKKIKKKIQNIVGIDLILPEIGEIVLNLKKATQTGQLKKTASKGFLLSGSPGNGKTLLVQAIAGESQIPVLIQSASLLINNKIQGQSHKKLKKIFRYAKEIGPAIIFIDEIDSLGKIRKNVFNNGNKKKKQFDFLNYYNINNNEDALPLSTKHLFLQNNKKSKHPTEEQSSTVELNLLTQFLIEMDGIQNQQKFIVFGATNRLKTLDPAFTRPGRFDRIITLDNPSIHKRLQILKFYSKKRQIEKTISWKYLLKKTKGLTASELASIMNESTIQSILKKTTHTVETIEKGIKLITSYGVLKQKSIKNIKTISYYQAGKTIGYTFLNDSNKNVLVTIPLWNQKENSRSAKLLNSINFENKTKIELENLLNFFYLGKASELILTKGKKLIRSHTPAKNYFNVFLNHDDFKNIEKIGFVMLDKWYLFSITIPIRKENQNFLKYQIETEKNSTRLISQSFFKQFKIKNGYTLKNQNASQENGVIVYWQNFLTSKTAQINKTKTDWYRFYISDPDEKIYNIEWIPPDLFLHTNSIRKNLSNQSNINWNSLYEIERDFFFHSLILNSFNKSLFKIETNREWVDYFSMFLLRYGVLREDKITKIKKKGV